MRQLTLSILCATFLFGCDKPAAPSAPHTAAQTATQTAAQTAAQAPTVDPHAQQEKPLVFVVQRRLIQDAEGLKDFEAYLSQATGKKVLTHVVPTDDQVIDMLKKGEAHMSYTEAWTFLVAHQRADMEVRAVTSLAGASTQDTLWVVTDKSPIKKLSDLKKRKIAFTTATSATGFLFPLAGLMRADVLSVTDDPETVFETVAFAGSEDAALAGLRQGKYDAAAIGSDAWSKDGGKGLKVLLKLGPVPREGFSLKSTLEPELKDKIGQAVLGLGQAKPELQKALFGESSFVSEAHYVYTDGMQQAIDTVDADYPL